MRCIVIDGGTTNTRLMLAEDGVLLKKRKLAMGAGHPAYKEQLKEALAELGDAEVMIASGMITSGLGLREVPHLPAPVDVSALRQELCRFTDPEVSSIPFALIPGVKEQTTDMMRGEETELFGIMAALGRHGPLTALLPGSHMKVITVDEQDRIIAIRTTMSGELLASVAGHTVLKNSFSLQDQREIDLKMLEMGYEACKKEGLNAALFRVRLMDVLEKREEKALYSFCLGAVLEGDIRLILQTAKTAPIIGGPALLREALHRLLALEGMDSEVLSDEVVEQSTLLGALTVYNKKGL